MISFRAITTFIGEEVSMVPSNAHRMVLDGAQALCTFAPRMGANVQRVQLSSIACEREIVLDRRTPCAPNRAPTHGNQNMLERYTRRNVKNTYMVIFKVVVISKCKSTISGNRKASMINMGSVLECINRAATREQVRACHRFRVLWPYVCVGQLVPRC